MYRLLLVRLQSLPLWGVVIINLTAVFILEISICAQTTENTITIFHLKIRTLSKYRQTDNKIYGEKQKNKSSPISRSEKLFDFITDWKSAENTFVFSCSTSNKITISLFLPMPIGISSYIYLWRIVFQKLFFAYARFSASFYTKVNLSTRKVILQMTTSRCHRGRAFTSASGVPARENTNLTRNLATQLF